MLSNLSTSVTWVFTGDSITHGVRHTNGQRNYVEHFAERVRGELKRYTDIVINTGVTNDTTNILLHTWETRVARFKADVVSVMEGTNDCYDGIISSMIPGMNVYDEAVSPEKFSDNLHEIIRRIRQTGAIPLLHTMAPVDFNTDLQRKKMPEYVEAVRTVARKEKAILVDNYKFWQTMPDIIPWLNDAYHPNESGHRAIAEEMFRTLDIN